MNNPESQNIDTPFRLHSERVRPEWIDYNDHMNVAYYVLVFDHATDKVLDHLNIGDAYRQRSSCSVFVCEAHVTYEQEAILGDELSIQSRILGFDGKRLILFHEMFSDRGKDLIASNEVMCLHVDLHTRRSAAIPAAIADRITRISSHHSALPGPSRAGRAIILDARRPK